MKKTFALLAVAGISALITYLAVTRHLIQERAAKLDRSLQEAEARIIQLESEAARPHVVDERMPDPGAVKSPPPTAPRTVHATPQAASTSESSGQGNASSRPSSTGATVAPLDQATAGVGLARFVTAISRGTTNLIRIEGTSSIHNWQVEGHLIGGMAEIEPGFPSADAGQVDPSKPITAKISSFVPVRSLKSVDSDGSPYSSAMDEIMFQKLRVEPYGRIIFTLSSLTMTKPVPDKPGVFVCEALGSLAVAGKTNDIKTPVVVSSLAKDRLEFAGAVRLKMTDFDIAPPSPSFGGVSIKTGDEVDVRFIWTVVRK